MAEAASLFDGHDALSGVSGAHPVLVPKNLSSNSVNRKFRGDENATRLPISHIELEYPEDQPAGRNANRQRHLFEGGNIQGAFLYHAYPSYLKSQLIVSVAGTIFRIELSGKRGVVHKLFEGNDPVLTHAWFAQAFEWLIIQDGLGAPILWNGQQDARRADRTIPEVPTGSVMAFIHGRLVVASADGTNQIAVGDIVYGNDPTTTKDVIKFTETGFIAEGGAFGLPVFIGDITGMYAMPYLDTGTGQNELVVLGTTGGAAFDFTGPRLSWLDRNLSRISLLGGGCVSSHSLCSLNGDLIYRSAEGVRSYRNARAEYQQTWHNTPISSDVRKWIRTDQPRLLEYASQCSWNNLLFSTCSPLLAKPNNNLAGHHRFHRGFVVMDAEPESTTLRTGAPIWQGMWTGIRPVQFVEGRIGQAHRCFAFSYDRDGVNRLYEINKDGTNDFFEGSPRKIFSFYDTSNMGVVERTTNNFQAKVLSGGAIEFSNLSETVETNILIRPDNSPCFVEIDTGEVGCECEQTATCFEPQQPRSQRKVFAGFETTCIPGTNQRLKNVRRWQGRVEMTGQATVERMSFWFSTDTEDKKVTCDTNCEPLTCCPHENDFSYHIAPPGENLNVPVLPQPSDVPATVYTSTKIYAVGCPEGTTGPNVIREATVTSTESQEAADILALQSAAAQAFAALVCAACAGVELVAVTVNNASYDFSEFFVDGGFPDRKGNPWRLIDIVTRTLYATGIVDENGTLQTTNAVVEGEDTFNSTSNIFTDTSGTSPEIALQLACPGTEETDVRWPDPPDDEPVYIY